MTIDPILYEYVASEVTFPDGELIIEEGSKGDWIYVILQGKAKVRKRTPKGMLTIDTLGEGDVFGEMSFLEPCNATRSASVIATEGPVRLGILDKELLIRDYEALSPKLRTLITSMITKLRETTSKVCADIVASD